MNSSFAVGAGVGGAMAAAGAARDQLRQNMEHLNDMADKTNEVRLLHKLLSLSLSPLSLSLSLTLSLSLSLPPAMSLSLSLSLSLCLCLSLSLCVSLSYRMWRCGVQMRGNASAFAAMATQARKKQAGPSGGGGLFGI